MTDRYTFCKAERLCSHKVIEALFAGGNKSFSAYPIRAVFMPVGEQVSGCQSVNTPTLPAKTKYAPVQLLISVSKRHFKHAVDRNRVKRQIREAYRLNKHMLLSSLPEGQGLAVAFIWLSNEHFETKVVEEKVKKLLQRLAEAQMTSEEKEV